MTAEEYKAKMAKIKKIVFALFLASVIVSVAAIALLVSYNFAGVFSLKTLDGYYQDGFTYPGWQTMYYGVGVMIIQGYTENTTDIPLILANFLPLFGTLILTSIVAAKRKTPGTNKQRAILEFVAAALLLVGGIMLFNCDKFWIANAQKVTGSYVDYYNVYLKPAMNGEVYFKKEAFPAILMIVCVLAAIIKASHGAILLCQKSFAKKNAPKKGQ